MLAMDLAPDSDDDFIKSVKKIGSDPKTMLRTSKMFDGDSDTESCNESDEDHDHIICKKKTESPD